MSRALCVILIVASVLIPAIAHAPAASAAPCSGASCASLDLQASGCAGDARTLILRDFKAENNASFRIEVRYSPPCRSAWGRMTRWSGSNVGFAMSAWNPGGTSRGVSVGSGNITWTAMIDGNPADCVGSHFYANGRWVRWYYIGCA